MKCRSNNATFHGIQNLIASLMIVWRHRQKRTVATFCTTICLHIHPLISRRSYSCVLHSCGRMTSWTLISLHLECRKPWCVRHYCSMFMTVPRLSIRVEIQPQAKSFALLRAVGTYFYFTFLPVRIQSSSEATYPIHIYRFELREVLKYDKHVLQL